MANNLSTTTFFFIFLFICSLLLACNNTSVERLANSVPTLSNEYTGNRIELVNIAASEEKGELIKITGTLINTGRN